MTLEDVAIQLGLRVDGRAIIRPSYLDCDELCERLLGVVPLTGVRKGFAIKLVWLRGFLKEELPSEPTQFQLQAFCKAYIFYLIKGVILSEKSANKVHLMYISLLIDFNNIRCYS
uniref:Serine/threonine protein phosphatase 7 long form isogeny n=1 Tax=Cajanus cajan TaxID=3821 RepID=A0A151UDJ7_CAJCA